MDLFATARATGCALLMLAAAGAPARSESLTLLIWDTYISPRLIERWKQRTHSEIKQIYFDSGDKRDSILSNPGTMVDLAVIDGARIDVLGKRGLLTDLHREGLPNLALIAPRWQNSCGRYGASYFWGMAGILYRADKVAAAPDSWSDILHPAPAMNQHIAMLKDDDEILAMPLSFLGKPTNTDNLDDLRNAFGLLKAQAPSVLTYDYVATVQHNPPMMEKIYMALGSTGDDTLLNRDPHAMNAWHFAVPKEGSVIWMDCLAALDKSAHRDLALKFIDFLNEPANAAENSIYLKMPTPNAAAMPLLPEALRNDREIYPAPEIVARSQIKGPSAAATLQLRRRIVSALVSVNDAQ